MDLGFLAISMLVVISPGTGVVYTVATGLSSGRRASVLAAFGCTLGIVPHMAAALTGLAALLYASAPAFEAMKYVGVAYLLYMAWQSLREGGALTFAPGRRERSSARTVLTAIAINLPNPKLSLFFLAFLPQFVRPEEPDRIGHLLTLSGVFMLETFVVFVAYGLLAAAARNEVIARPRILLWLRRGIAAAFVALGVRLATSSR